MILEAENKELQQDKKDLVEEVQDLREELIEGIVVYMSGDSIRILDRKMRRRYLISEVADVILEIVWILS